MAYRRAAILRHVAARLTAEPRVSLKRLAGELDLDRRTVERALAARGLTFRDLRRRWTLAAIARQRALTPPQSQKQIARALGFPSAAALKEFCRRLGAAPNAAKRSPWPPSVPLTGRDSTR